MYLVFLFTCQFANAELDPERTVRKRLHLSSGLCYVAEASPCPQFGDLVICFYYKCLFVFLCKLLSHPLAHLIVKTLWRIIILIFLRNNWDPETSWDLFRAMHSINWTTESGPKSRSAACQRSTAVDYTTPPSRGTLVREQSFLCLLYVLAVAKNVCSSCPALTYSKRHQLVW